MITCPRCQTENPTAAHFCKECGQYLDAECPNCGTILPKASRYCIECGIQLANTDSLASWSVTRSQTLIAKAPDNSGQSQAEAADDLDLASRESPQQNTAAGKTSEYAAMQHFLPKELATKLEAMRTGGQLVGERRVVTMLFCDIQGSTAAAEKLDPEEWTEVINGAFEHMIRPIYKYEGTVARLMGDAILAFFGAPIAHEDDPIRAVLAALEIVAGFKAYIHHVHQAHGVSISVRVGINTGTVVAGAVGSDLRMEYTAMGDAVNVAARMEQSAEPGTVQIAQSTYNLVASRFEFQELGGISVKGKSKPVSAYRVLKRKAQPDRQRGIATAQTRLVGRTWEMKQIQDAVDRLGRGVGSVICLVGEAGLGKSRIAQELREHWTVTFDASMPGNDRQLAMWQEAASYSYETLQPYALIQRLLRRIADVWPGDVEDDAKIKIEGLVAGLPDEWRARCGTAFSSLLGFSSELEGEAFKETLFECLPRFLRHRYSAAPGVLVLDDIHWSDSASIELLLHLLPLVNDLALLLLCLIRPDPLSPGWRVKSAIENSRRTNSQVITLHPLNEVDSNSLINELLAIGELPMALRDRILAKSSGNPFFVEEVIRTLLEQGYVIQGDDGVRWNNERGEDLEIPDHVQMLLTARIDRLADEERHTLQLASVFGRTFYQPVLLIVAEPDFDDTRGIAQRIEEHLTTLEIQQMILEVARIPEQLYEFRHTLTQEAVYKTILHSNRRAYHLRAGRAIEQFFSNDLEENAAALAHHFQAAGEDRAAFRYLVLAGGRSLRLYALQEAIIHYDRAMAIALQTSEVDSELLVDLCNKRGRSLELLGKHDQALQHYREMYELARRIDHDRLALTSLMAQAVLYNTPSAVMDAAKGREAAQEARQLADSLGDWEASAKLLWTMMLGATWVEDDAFKAVQYGEESVSIAAEHNLERQLAYSELDLVPVYMSVGRGDDARRMILDSKVRLEALNDRPLLAQAYRLAGNLYHMQGQLVEAEKELQQAIDIERTINNRWGLLAVEHILGMVDYERGDIGQAIERLDWVLREAVSLGLGPLSVWIVTYLAMFYALLGDWSTALAVLEHVFNDKDNTESYPPWIRAYHSSIRGLVLLQKGDVQEATKVDRLCQINFNPDRPLTGGVMFAPVTIRLVHIGVASARGELEQALKDANELLEYLASMKLRLYYPEAYYLKGQILHGLSQPVEARESWSLALAESEAMGERRVRWQILAGLAGLTEDDGEVTALLQSAQKVIDYIADHAGLPERKQSFLNRAEVRQLQTTLNMAHQE